MLVYSMAALMLGRGLHKAMTPAGYCSRHTWHRVSERLYSLKSCSSFGVWMTGYITSSRTAMGTSAGSTPDVGTGVHSLSGDIAEPSLRGERWEPGNPSYASSGEAI